MDFMNRSGVSKKVQEGQGVALLELLVVVLIIGLISALVVPSMGKFMTGVKLRTGSRDVMNILRIARETAIREQAPHKVRVDFVHGSILLTDAYGGLLRQYDLGKDVEIEAIRIEGADTKRQEVVDIIFFPEGSATAAELVLKNPGTENRVVLLTDAVTGTVQILPPKDSLNR